jgi:hypothetical protein
VSGAVPSGSLKIETIGVAAIFWLLCDLIVGDFVVDLHIEVKLIDGDNMLSRIVLQATCEEGLREEETTQPEYCRGASLNPLLKEVYSVIQILSPRCKGLQGQETYIGSPSSWDLIVKERCSHLIEILTHDDLTLNCLLNISKHFSHNYKQLVVSNDFLGKHSVHGLGVLSGEFLSDHVIIEWKWSL